MSDPFRDWLNNMPPSEGDREVEGQGEERVHAALRDGTLHLVPGHSSLALMADLAQV